MPIQMPVPDAFPDRPAVPGCLAADCSHVAPSPAVPEQHALEAFRRLLTDGFASLPAECVGPGCFDGLRARARRQPSSKR
jgi:hypothetical protein